MPDCQLEELTVNGTLTIIQDDIIKYREGLEQNIHDQLTDCKQEIM